MEAAPEELGAPSAGEPEGPPVVGDAVTVGAGGSVAVLDTEAGVSGGRLFAPARGNEYFAVRVRGCSGPQEHGLSFEAVYFTLEMADRTFHGPGLPIKRPQLSGGAVPAGDCLEGWVTFTVPEKAEPAFVIYHGSVRVKWRVPTEEVSAAGS